MKAAELTVSSMPGAMRDYWAVLKPRITIAAVVAVGVGFYLGQSRPMDTVALARLAWTLLGAAAVIAGANALNQVIERSHDARMARTADRPVASGRLAARRVVQWTGALAAAGVIVLGLLVNPVCAAVAAAAWALYVFVYTPLKRVTPWSLVVGAVPGALPPVIGWSAATGTLDIRAGALFAIMVVWQLPHFLSIAWLYREDYAGAGYRVLPVVEPTGRRLVIEMIAYSLLLIPVSLLPTYLRMAGFVYYIGAWVLGFAFLAFGLEVARLRTRLSARQHMLASLLYLSCLFGLLVFDKGSPAFNG